ncbi:DUF6603 domain-containing protein [Archangium violaceum]|uniref:DUF6603 domain-containing protein n=1 Tax=Archangium violaceum TaxID=83451 RepID=UPI002B291795|nr:DUF6603 domain-containing protein [Archangium gephyra]
MSDPRDSDLLTRLLAEILAFASPVTLAAGNAWQRDYLLELLGWDPGALAGYSDAQLETWCQRLAAARTAMEGQLALGAPDSLEEVVRRLRSSAELVRALTDLLPALTPQLGQLPAGTAELLGEDLLNLLALTYLKGRWPIGYQAAVLLGLITPARDNPVSLALPSSGPPVRLPMRRDTLHLDRLGHLLSDPLGHLKAVYAPQGLGDAALADATADLLFPRVAAILRELGLSADYGIREGNGPDMGPVGTALARHMLTLRTTVPLSDTTQAGFGASLALSPPGRGDLGLVVMPFGSAAYQTVTSRWALGVMLTGGSGVEGSPFAFGIGPQGFSPPTGGGNVRLDVNARLLPGTVSSTGPDAPSSAPPAWTLGSPAGTRLEVGELELSAMASFLRGGANGSRDELDYGFGLKAGSSALVLSAGADADGFLAKVLPAQGVRVPFSLGLGWSRRAGLTFTGGASLDTTLPVHLDLGPVRIERVRLAIAATEGNPSVSSELTADVRLDLGVVKALAQRIGVAFELSRRPGGGNAGPLEVTPRFRPPDGMALSIVAGPVTGAGYLMRDTAGSQYAGAAELGIGDFRLTAVGILGTRLPGGAEGWSMLLLGTGEWPPVQLGLGFTLDGMGMLVGVNRTSNTDALRNSVRSGALDAVLFPRDVVQQAPALVSTLNELFPAAANRHVLGLMVRVGWGGTPASQVLRIDAALLLELPAPLRLIVLGRLLLGLPSIAAPLVRLQLDAVGIFDAERKEISVDASLRDSKIAGLPLTGDMALRVGYGAVPQFALSAGGFHPRFTPPPGFPSLRRIALALTEGDNPRLRLQAYLALTANTVQFGSRLDLRAEAMGFSVEGVLGFDALIYLDPFGFLIDCIAQLAVRFQRRNILTVKMELTLSGPQPWWARGHASFGFLWWDVRIKFDVRVGSSQRVPAAPPVDLRGELRTALEDPAAWSVLPPGREAPVVALRALEPRPGELLAHPFGSVAVQQRAVPLATRLEQVGRAPVLGGPVTFNVSAVRCGGIPVTSGVGVLREQFAPSTYRRMTDEERLTAPSFVSYEAGRQFGAPGSQHPGTKTGPDGLALSVVSVPGYETVIVDSPDFAARRQVTPGLSAAALAAMAETGPAARARTRDRGSAYFRTGTVALGPLVLNEDEGVRA